MSSWKPLLLALLMGFSVAGDAVAFDLRYLDLWRTCGSGGNGSVTLEEAIVACSEYAASADENDRWEGYFNRALWYRRLRRNDEAIADMSEAIRLQGDRPELLSTRMHALDQRAHWYTKIGRYDLSYADYERGEQLWPTFESWRIGMCWSRLLARQLDDALAECEVAAAAFPNSYGVFYHRGLTRLVRGEFDEATSDFRRSADIAPDEGSRALGQYGAGVVLTNTGRESEGRAAMLTAAERLGAVPWEFGELGY